MAQIAYKIETRKPAIKIASKLLLKICHDDNDADAMESMGTILTAEAKGNVDFFLSALDQVIKFCDELKQDIIDESKKVDYDTRRIYENTIPL